MSRSGIIAALLACLGACASVEPTSAIPRCEIDLVVLGVGQDGGAPQLGRDDDPAWAEPRLRQTATSLGLRDGASGRRWLFEATPDIREQLHAFNQIAPASHTSAGGLDGIFLTHAHIGHYAGLMFFGHESMGASSLRVYAMPRMAAFLTENGPWSQLVGYGNIDIEGLEANSPVALADQVRVVPFEVPHRQEFSEVVGYRIEGPNQSALFVPDIDSWEQWDAAGTRIEDEIARVDIAFLDATFYANGEIPGRDMTGFPHPFIVRSMERLASLPAIERAKVRFIHFNHTNPVRFNSAERGAVLAAGFNVATPGERHCL